MERTFTAAAAAEAEKADAAKVAATLPLARQETPRHFRKDRRQAEPPEFHRVIVTPTLPSHKPTDSAHRDVRQVATNLCEMLELRRGYVYQRQTPEWEDGRLQAFDERARRHPFDLSTPDPAAGEQYTFSIGRDGVAAVSRNGEAMAEWAPPSLGEFTADLERLYTTVCCGKSENTFCHKVRPRRLPGSPAPTPAPQPLLSPPTPSGHPLRHPAPTPTLPFLAAGWAVCVSG